MNPAEPRRDGTRAIISGAGMLSVAMLLANIGNYALNIFLGRVLTPAEFSDANLMVTLMLTATAVALGLEMVTARYTSVAEAGGNPGAADLVARRLRWWTGGAGVVAAVALIAPAPLWSDLFQTASAWPFVVLGLGLPFYLQQAIGRGVMQGRLRFGLLASTFVIEMVTRLSVAIALVAAGWGVVGATIGLSASFIVTWVSVTVLARASGERADPAIPMSEVGRYGAFVSVLLAAQMIANNSDVLVSKAVLAPDDAGTYAAVALVGRAVFYLAWSVATVVFPVVARRHAGGDDSGGILRGSILVISAMGGLCALGALWLGGPVLGIVIGPAYADLSVPLAAYALATTLFAVANLVASVALSTGVLRPSVFVLGGALAQLMLLLIWHDDIAQLILVQIIAMSALVAAMAIDAAVRRPTSARHDEGAAA
ncbi:oligosaccharide flippase family protein [Microbacterium sp. SSW1-59]|uniref:oligosaccharide flippase family protein n=1 Tax=Microbacterium xanthum TaxID=3079794 RepID=UPI002AD2457C|nr:oligosaccharide flippase family protein [Microbacterium sp. SSW1-59]MDZ8200407.1 oligosaccharide flippase family protein [Microbacterium sp. SSW1-59]